MSRSPFSPSHLASLVADPVRRWGQRRLGRDFDRARFAHWISQWYPGWLVKDRQLQRLVALVDHARSHSGFYRERLASLPTAFDFAAYAEIPPLTRAELLEHAAAIRCGPARASRASGGSGGRGIRVPVDPEAYAWYVAGTWLGLQWWGTGFTERGALVLGPRPRGPLALACAAKDWVLNWLRVPVGPGFDSRAAEVLHRLRAFSPAYLYAYPSAAHRLAREILEGRVEPPRGLKVVVLTGEPVYGFQRQDVEAAFGCPVAVEYGSGEVGSVAFECPHGTLHVLAESVYVESVVTPDVPEVCSLLVTQLHNRVFPLLRYRIGDLGVVRESGCPCGRGFPEVRVLGRAHDRLVGPGYVGAAYPLLDRLFHRIEGRLRGGVRLRHDAPGRVTVEVDGGSDRDLRQVQDLAVDLLGPGWRVEAVACRFGRLPSGKLPYFIRDGQGPLPHQ